MDIRQIHHLVENETALQPSDLPQLKEIVDRYSYFQAGIFAYLKSVYLFDNPSFDSRLRKYSIFVGDRKALFFYILNEEYSLFFSHIKKKELNKDRTDVLLNAFFETHEAGSLADLEYTLSHTTMASSDYFLYVENVEKKHLEEDLQSEKQVSTNLNRQDIIDTFIEKSEEGGIQINIDKGQDNKGFEVSAKTEEHGEDELNDDLFFTETLAKIYIKQRKYDKAYKIIKHLSLNFPKKNVYFADQLSFLEKLIINSKFKDKKW